MNQISKNFYTPPLSTKELNTSHMVDFKNKGVSIYGTGNYGIIIFTALKINCLASMAEVELFVYKFTIPLVLR